MPDEIKEQVEGAVLESMDSVRENITKDLTAYVDEQTGDKYGELSKSMQEIQEQLDGLQKAGEDPNSEKVEELEKRLEEAEANSKDLEENLRLMKTRREQPSEDDEPSFKGMFFADEEALRQRIRDMQGFNDTRAIDSSLFTTGGKLSAETADMFIDNLIDQQVTLSRITVRRMNNPQGKIDKLTVGNRKLVKAGEATEPNTAEAVGTKRRDLETVEVIWAEDLTLTFLEDNIERRGGENHIARLLSTGFGNDLNDLAWNGGHGASTDFIAINDGFITLALADSDVNDVASFDSTVDTASEVMQLMLQSLPSKFLGRTDLVYFVPVRMAQEYADELSKRQTAQGDDVMINGFPALRYFGRPVIPETHLGGDEAMLTPAPNLVFGIQRSITVDSEWQPRARVVEYTLSARNDYNYADGEAIVLADSIPTAVVGS